MKYMYICLILTQMSCANLIGQDKPKSIRQVDLDSWKNVSRIELETHPFFTQFERKVQKLSNGNELWIYSNCHDYTNPISCNSYSWSRQFNSLQCAGGNTERVCCHNQFFVDEDKVIEYRPVGRCYTDCIVVPQNKLCIE
ncbi:MAG: hypothetical protein ABFD50_04550 [Smithella sp.]